MRAFQVEIRNSGVRFNTIAWPTTGTPFNPGYMLASVFRDLLYHTHQLEKEASDTLFHDLLILGDVVLTKATLIHATMRDFQRWYWDNDTEDNGYLRGF